MSCKKFYIVVLGLVLVSIGVLLYISLLDFSGGNYCFRIMGIPACYIAFGYTLLLLFFHLLRKMELAFLIMVSFVLSLAIFETFTYFLGYTDCRIAVLHIPICYVVLIYFTLLLWVKFLEIKCTHSKRINKKPS